MAGDSLSPLLVQVGVISPALSWILRPGRFSRRRGFVLAVSFLALVAAVTIVRSPASLAASAAPNERTN